MISVYIYICITIPVNPRSLIFLSQFNWGRHTILVANYQLVIKQAMENPQFLIVYPAIKPFSRRDFQLPRLIIKGKSLSIQFTIIHHNSPDYLPIINHVISNDFPLKPLELMSNYY